jgi:hypothetical protein
MDVHRGRILYKDMHRESDGPQNLQFHYFQIEDIVQDLFADPMAKGKQHLYFRRDIGPDGKRRFTDAHTCLAFKHAAREIGEGVVHFFLVLYVDGTSQSLNGEMYKFALSRCTSQPTLRQESLRNGGRHLLSDSKLATFWRRLETRLCSLKTEESMVTIT